MPIKLICNPRLDPVLVGGNGIKKDITGSIDKSGTQKVDKSIASILNLFTWITVLCLYKNISPFLTNTH